MKIQATLIVSNLDRTVDFYVHRIGLQVHRRDAASAALGVGAEDLLLLEESPHATRPDRAAGLYHIAILLPTRLALAQQLRHFAEAKVPLFGFADHLVSEALYLNDPEGNGLEVYRDRPRSEWIHENGGIRITTDPLDVEGLLDELDGAPEPWSGMPAGTTIGHVHLRVSDVAAAEAFYRNLGFDVMTRLGRNASFLSTEGYHHHLGINSWESAGAPPAPDGALGLKNFTLVVDDQFFEAAQSKVVSGELDGVIDGERITLRDPSGNRLQLNRSITKNL
ncbi:VOC family protein [soil metagenome]